jgi:hypothetical protein
MYTQRDDIYIFTYGTYVFYVYTQSLTYNGST